MESQTSRWIHDEEEKNCLYDDAAPCRGGEERGGEKSSLSSSNRDTRRSELAAAVTTFRSRVLPSCELGALLPRAAAGHRGGRRAAHKEYNRAVERGPLATDGGPVRSDRGG